MDIIILYGNVFPVTRCSAVESWRMSVLFREMSYTFHGSCTLVRGEEGPRVPIPSLQTIKCSFLNFSILEGYWLCIGVVLTTLVNEMVPEWAQESDHNINSAYRAYLLVSSYLLSNTSQRIVCINDLTWTSSTCVIIPLSYKYRWATT